MDKTNWPTWLKNAEISENAQVEIIRGIVVWKGGIWKYGVWKGGVWEDGVWEGGAWGGGIWKYGVWKGGIWKDGVWEKGTWKGGVWKDSIWKDGVWENGTWMGGVWKGGIWKYGVWEKGTWKDDEDRLLYMASLLGIVFDNQGYGYGYRTTSSDGRGRHNVTFIQPEGEYFEENLPASGTGTCCKGIHISNAATAWTYFGKHPTCQFWRVKFHKHDLLDCDGQKARIRGGYFEKIDRPF